MSKDYDSINESTGTFAGWLTQSNDLFDDMTNIIVTVSTTSGRANSTNNSTTSGNGHINGIFSSDTLVVNTAIHGGDATSSFSDKATLFVTSNVTIGTTGTPENLLVWGDSTLKGNVTIGTATTDALLIESNTNINGKVFFHANAQFDDSDYLKFGDDGDVTIAWRGDDLYTRFASSNANFIIEDSSGNDIILIDIDTSTLTIRRWDDESPGPSIVLQDRGSTTPDSANVGGIFFKGLDSANVITEYAYIRGIAEDNTDATEDGSLTLYTRIDNTRTVMIAINEGNDAAVSLRYDGSKKLATKTDGVDIIGELQSDSLDVDGVWDITGIGTLHADTQWDDNARLKIGSSADLQVYHDATNSHLINSTGELYIQGDGITIRSNTGTEEYITADVNGAVTLYYDDVAKLATTATGVAITGAATISSTLDVEGAATINSTLDVTANATFGASIDVTNDAVINGDLTIQGNFLATGSTNMTVNTATFTTMTVIGNAELGDSASDTLTITARINSDIVPSTDSARDLGTSALRFAEAYVDDAFITANVNIEKAGHLKFYETDNNNFVAFKSADTVTNNVIWTLPNADATVSGYALVSNGAGTLSWAAAGATTTSDTTTNAEEQLYFSDITNGAVTAVHHDSDLTYNPSLGRLTVDQIRLRDSKQLNFGADTDAEFYHNGSHMIMDINTGGLYVRDGTNSNAPALTFTPTTASLLLVNYDSAIPGSEIILRHDSVSPAASDEIGQILFQGRESSATNITYAFIDARIVDPTDLSEDGSLRIYAKQAGTDRIHFSADSGVTTLYHNGIAKIATTSTGIDVTGTAEMDTLSIGGTAVTSTPAELNVLDGYTGSVTELNYLDTLHATGVTSTEFDYLDGVTSNIQTQLNGKQATITGGATTIVSSNLTASRALISNSSGKVEVSAVTSTELGYLDGVTSAIQTQLNAKAPLASPALTGTATAVNLTVSGNLTVNGTTTTLNTTNIVVSDNIIELNNGVSSNANDSGIIIERGTTGANAFMGWDESADKFIVGTTTSTGSSTGNLTITAGTLVASTFEGNLSGNATTATGATNININATTSTDTTTYPVLVGAASTGNQIPFIDNTDLSYNASTGTLSATVFSGSGASLTALNADNISTGTLASARIEDNAITTAKIAADAVNGTKIADDSINAEHLNISNGNGLSTQFLRSDGDGSFTWAIPTNTTYSAGTGMSLSGTTFSIGQAVATTSSVQFGSLGVGTPASGTGAIRATGNITAYYSDRRLKDDITPINNALDKIAQISGVTYRSNDIAKEHGYTSDKLQYGVIAQEVEAIMPEIVVPAPFDIEKNEETGEEYSKTGENYKTVQYEKIIPLLIEAIKELKAEIKELKKR